MATLVANQLPDVGISASRYMLMLDNKGNARLVSWDALPRIDKGIPFPWKADTWYHLKLRVENLPNGQVRARGKAWPTGQPEPAAWTIEKTDPIGNHEGAPGLFIDAQFGAHVDNMVLTRNQ